jgi:PAS domain S-box-containing protein
VAHILVVDDEPASRELLTTLLGYHGHSILVACDGAEGLTLALAEQPDLIITDILMPELDGYALATRVRADPTLAHIQIIFYTAIDLGTEVRQLATASGVAHIVTKPAEPETILAIVHSALASVPPMAPPTPTAELDHAYLRRLTGTLHRNVEALKAEIQARAQAEARLRAQTARLTVLADASRAFAAVGQEFPAALNLIVRTIAQALGDTCAIYLLSDDGADLPIAAIYDADPAMLEHIRTVLADALLQPPDDSYVHRVFASVEPLLLPVVDSYQQPGSARSEHWQLLDRLCAHSLIIAPLRVEQRAIGLLHLTRRQREQPAYTADDLQLAQDLADRAALAITNVRLFAQLQAELTERIRVEGEVSISEERFAKAFQIGPVAMVLSTVADGRILDINHSFLRLFGYTSDVLPGQTSTLFDLWANRDDGETIVELLRLQGTVRDLEVAIRTASGAIRDVLLSADTLQLGGELCLITSLYDISERKQSEVVLRATSLQLQDLSRRLVATQEAERRHLARELHDEIGQMLTGLNLLLETGNTFSERALLARLREAQAVVTDLTARVRTLSLDLRPSMLDDLGLLPALLWHFERYTTQTQVHVAFKHSGLDQSLDPLITIAVYRVVQEALTNVARYAQVTEVMVAVWTQGSLIVVSIEDQGCGFDLDTALAARNSSGLAGMQERVTLLGGQMMIDTAPGQGTRVLVELPLNRPERREGEVT